MAVAAARAVGGNLARRRPGRRAGHEGQAVAEFLVVVPVLLLLFVALVGFGYYIHANMIVFQAANRAARIGAVLYGDSDVSRGDAYQRTRAAAMGLLSTLRGNERSVTIRDAGDDLHVTVRYRTNVFVPFMRPWLGDDMEVEWESIYRIERDTE